MSLVSTVIPAYNAERTIVRALESVMAQEIPGHGLEVLVVDDGSSDGTVAAVQAFVARTAGSEGGQGGSIRILRQANAGPSAARNAGVREAAGDLIAFLDADDEWLPGKLALQVAVLERRPEADLVCTPMNGRRFGRGEPELDLSFQSLLRSNRVHTSSVLVKKAAFLAAGGFDPARRLSEDYELWLKIAARGLIVVLNEPLLRYEEGSGVSSRLWPMERGELETLGILHTSGLLPGPAYHAARGWSFMKFLLRAARRISRRMIGRIPGIPGIPGIRRRQD